MLKLRFLLKWQIWSQNSKWRAKSKRRFHKGKGMMGNQSHKTIHQTSARKESESVIKELEGLSLKRIFVDEPFPTSREFGGGGRAVWEWIATYFASSIEPNGELEACSQNGSSWLQLYSCLRRLYKTSGLKWFMARKRELHCRNNLSFMAGQRDVRVSHVPPKEKVWSYLSLTWEGTWKEGGSLAKNGHGKEPREAASGGKGPAYQSLAE